MASRIDHMLFWTGGVILPQLSRLALRALPVSERNLALERRLAELERQLAQGELAPPAFCELAASAAGEPEMAQPVMDAVLAEAGILPGMAGLLEELAPHVRLGLLSDYPQPWLQVIANRLGPGLARPFGPDDIHYTASWPGPDLFEALVKEGVIHPGRTLWVDHDSPRAIIAVRRGIDAAICVDARRLRRDLSLWGLVPMASV